MDILLPVKSQNGRIYTYKIKKYTASEVRMESGYNPITLSGKGGETECNKLIAYRLLVCHRSIKAFPNAEAGISALASLSPCMPYRPHSPHRSMEEPTGDECYIHVRRGGKRLTAGVTEQNTKLLSMKLS